jgi:predicted PurR-regulated permease PerM
MPTERIPLGEWTLRVFVTLLTGVLFLAVWELRDVFLLTFLAVIVAIVLQLPVRYLERMGLSRGLSIGVTMIITLTVLGLLVVLIVPVFVQQVADLVDELPGLIDQARDEYDQRAERYAWLPEIDWDNVTEGSAQDFVINQAGDLSRNIFPFLSGVGGALTSFVFMLFIAIFFVTEPVNYLEGLLTLIPRSYRPRALEIFQHLGGMLQRWFVGQLISMTMSGIMIAFVTGVILGLPNAVALGVISGLMEFIPNFGSIIAVIPAVIIALAEDPVLVPVVIAAYLIVQQVQSNVVMPRIMSRQISIPAAFILIAQIIGAALFGFMGILLALPMAIVVMVLVREIYVFDILNSRPARLQNVRRVDGTTAALVTTDVYRPEELTPGQAAVVRAQGRNLFDPGEEGQVVEIITPPSPALEQAARGQQMVWIALLTLTVAQGLALVRSLLVSGKGDESRG